MSIRSSEKLLWDTNIKTRFDGYENRIVIERLLGLFKGYFFPEEKWLFVLEIRKRYTQLNAADKEKLTQWLSGRYTELIKCIIESEADAEAHTKLAYRFRWSGLPDVTPDLDFCEQLIKPLINKEIFAESPISPLAHFCFGSLQFQKYLDAYRPVDRSLLFKVASKHLRRGMGTAKGYYWNRCALFLAKLNLHAGKASDALLWYKKSLEADSLAPDQYDFLFSFVVHGMPEAPHDLFANIRTIFSKKNVASRRFWDKLSYVTNRPEQCSRIEQVRKLVCRNSELNPEVFSDVENRFFNALAAFLKLLSSEDLPNSIAELQQLAGTAGLTTRGKALFHTMVASYIFHNFRAPETALQLASTANVVRFSDEAAQLISTIILSEDPPEIRRLISSSKTSNNPNVAAYQKEMHNQSPAWRSFCRCGFVTGNIQEEIEFLNLIGNETINLDLKNLISLRLANLHFQGSAGISIDGHKMANYSEAKRLSEYLVQIPAYARLATQLLKHPRIALYTPLEQNTTNGNYLLFKRKPSKKLLIVFSCAASHFHYAHLKGLYEDHWTNVLFINNPPYNWYSDNEWNRICALIRKVALKKFNRKDICTYFGSMGGYAAIRVALEFGFKSVVFNPQYDLNVWQDHRPLIRSRLAQIKDLISLDSLSTKKYERTPIYWCGSATVEDFEAFRSFVLKISQCKNGVFIIERLKDNVHPGVFASVYNEQQIPAINHIWELSERLNDSATYIGSEYQLPVEEHSRFWEWLTYNTEARIIVQIVDGKLHACEITNNFSTPIDINDFRIINLPK